MNRNDFLRMVENSGPVDRQMIGEVSDLINIFPYFQSAYLLLLKGLQNTGDVKFENQLRVSAIHIADREVLYYLLKKEPSVNVEHEVTSKQPVTSEINPEDSQQVVIETAKNSEDLINEIEKSSDDGKNEDQAENVQQNTGHSILITTETDNEEFSSMVFLVDEESGSVEEKVIYMDPGFSVPEHVDLLELDLENKAPVPEEDSRTEEQPDYSEINSEKQRQTDLIDKFILTNPRIEPVKEKSDAPVEDISKPFVEAKGGFLTETLARIYIRQGYYSKAINVYEKLCLKFPEKCSYFAGQIEKVNELIKK
ncbi:MAG: tetratricopeptide repeat-containing protein [Bacteroidales bacterium]|nr:tetratricopeptide repeat-containing protein [Bacteroidales bacterium]